MSLMACHRVGPPPRPDIKEKTKHGAFKAEKKLLLCSSCSSLNYYDSCAVYGHCDCGQDIGWQTAGDSRAEFCAAFTESSLWTAWNSSTFSKFPGQKLQKLVEPFGKICIESNLSTAYICSIALLSDTLYDILTAVDSSINSDTRFLFFITVLLRHTLGRTASIIEQSQTRDPNMV